MAAVAKWYAHGAISGDDWQAKTIRVALLDAAYTPDQANHHYFADVSAHEIAGTGYTAGGVALGNKTAVVTGETMTLSADPVSWANGSFSCRYMAIYEDTGNPATDLLLGYIDLGAVQTVGGSTFSIAWSGSGILASTAS